MFMGRLLNNHICKQCSRSFKDINNYKEHCFQEHQINGSQKVHKCTMCSYATLLKSKYDCHMRCHLNNQVIKCKHCDYSTINIRHMSRHERSHILSSSITRSIDQQHDINKRKLLVQSAMPLMDSIASISSHEYESRMKKAKIIKHDFPNATFSRVSIRPLKSKCDELKDSTRSFSTSVINHDELENKSNDTNHFNQSNAINNSFCFESVTSNCIHKLQFEVLQKKFFKMLLLLVPQISTNLVTVNNNANSNILEENMYSSLNFTQTNEIIDYLTRFFETNITSDNVRI